MHNARHLTILISLNFNVYPVQRERIHNVICSSYSSRAWQYQFKAIIILWVGSVFCMFIWKISIIECIHKVCFQHFYPLWLLKWNILKNSVKCPVSTLLTLLKIKSYCLTPLKIIHIVNYIWHMQLWIDIFLHLIAEQGLELFVATVHFKCQEYNICCDDMKINKLVKYLWQEAKKPP